MTSQSQVAASRALAAYILGTGFFLYAFVQRVSPSVMTGELMRDFNADGTAIGALSGMYFYTYAALQIPVGILVDRYGPRKLLAASAVVSALASLGFAMSTDVLTASISRAVIGGSVAFAFVATLSIAAMFFKPVRFAMLAGILLAVGMAGAIVGQAPMRMLVEAVGWRGSYEVLASWAVVMAVLAYLIVPKRPSTSLPNPEKKQSFVAWGVFYNSQTWLCGAIGFTMTTVMLTFGGLWSVPWLITVHGLSASEASLLTSSLFIGWLIASPVAGWLSDKIKKRKPVLLFGASLCFVSFLLIVLMPGLEPSGLRILYLLNGMGASCMVVCFGLVREWNPPSANGTAIGFANMCVVASGALLQPLVGWILDSRWQGKLIDGVREYPAAAFETAFYVLLAIVLTGVVCILFVKESHCQQQLTG